MAADPLQQRAFLKWAGWSGLIGTLAFVVTIVMTTGGVANPEGPGDIARLLTDIADGGYGIAGLVLVVLYVPMAVGVYRLLDKSTVPGALLVLCSSAINFRA